MKEELDTAIGANSTLDSFINDLKSELGHRDDLELRARSLTEMMAVALQGALLVKYAPSAVSDAFCASRLGSRWSAAYGTLPVRSDYESIIKRAFPL